MRYIMNDAEVSLSKYLLVGEKLNTKTLLVVSECLKDRAFHIQTVYVNSLDPNGIVWRLGNPQFRKVSRVVTQLQLNHSHAGFDNRFILLTNRTNHARGDR